MDLYDLKLRIIRNISFLESDLKAEKEQKDNFPDTKLEMFVKGKIEANEKSLEYHKEYLEIIKAIETTQKILEK